MKTSKKCFSVLLALAMIFTMILPSFATAKDYDVKKVYAEDEAYYADETDGLSVERVASVILDWLDRQIAAKTAEFGTFNVEVYGQEIPVSLANINSLDAVIAYKDNLTELGGDFAKLDTSKLTTRSAAGSDLQFIFNVISFMADNADIFGKIFAWDEDGDETKVTFDFGKVGEYIEALESDDPIREFYENWLLGNDIQEKFVAGIAKEMDYTVKDGETFDEVLDNGIKASVISLLKKMDLISEDLENKINDDDEYNLKTENVYDLIEKLCGDIQSDNWGKIKTYFTYLCDNVARPILKTAFGYTLTETATQADETVLNEFKAAYDLDVLAELAGNGNVLFQTQDGKYYSVKADGSEGKEVTYGESFLNFEPPTVKIGDKDTVIGTYTPTNPDVKSYQPTVYTSQDYSAYIDEEMLAAANDFGITVTADALPEAVSALIANGNGTEMAEEFKMNVTGKVMNESINEDFEITFEDLEKIANAAIAEALPTIQTQVDSVVATAVATANNMPIIGGSITGSATINRVTVKLSYTGYSDDEAGTFVCEVTAVPTIDATFNGNVWTYASMVGMTQEKIKSDYIQPAINNAITNPVATVVVTDLNGTVDGLDDLTALLNYVDTDFDVDASILDFTAGYDTYKGVVGQANRVLCDVLEMFLSDEGYTSLGLTEGSNDNFTANMQKICAKTDTLLSAAKAFMDKSQFSAFAETVNMDSLFASEHGFNAGMLYDLDFSSVENVYVCAIRMLSDLLIEDKEGTLYDLHLIVEDLDTLDAMAVGVGDYFLEKVIAELNKQGAEKDGGLLCGFIYEGFKKEKIDTLNTAVKNGGAGYAENVIMTKLVDLLYYTVGFAAEKILAFSNDTLAGLAEDLGIKTPVINFVLGIEKGNTWEETLTNMVDRFYELTDGIFVNETIMNAKDGDVYTKINAIANEFLPLRSMLSNANDKGTDDIDTAYLLDVFFEDMLNGNFDTFLKLFEVKDDAIAGACSVTEALINASEHMVDPIFPDTVKSELYVNLASYSDFTEQTVQEYFTSRENDIVIAANNMKSIDGVKATLVPAVLKLIKNETGLLRYCVACDTHTYTKDDWTNEVSPVHTQTTIQNGVKGYYTCTVCGALLNENGEEIAEEDLVILVAHNYTAQSTDASYLKAGATCKSAAVYYKSCTVCGLKGEATFTSGSTVNHSYTVKTKDTVTATCTVEGKTAVYQCAWCDATTGGTSTGYASHTPVAVDQKNATCTENGNTAGHKCSVCGTTIDGCETLAALGHDFVDGTCTRCGATESVSFFQRIINFFNSIINWFKSLFG